MANAPYCNVDVATPDAHPSSPKGIQRIPANANQQQIINITNNNFARVQLGQFVENKGARRTQVVRIFDPSDRSVFVDVQQITHTEFVNSTTGQKIIWSR